MFQFLHFSERVLAAMYLSFFMAGFKVIPCNNKLLERIGEGNSHKILCTATVGGCQWNAKLSGWGFSIGYRQRLLETVAWKVAQCLVVLKWPTMMSPLTTRQLAYVFTIRYNLHVIYLRFFFLIYVRVSKKVIYYYSYSSTGAVLTAKLHIHNYLLSLPLIYRSSFNSKTTDSFRLWQYQRIDKIDNRRFNKSFASWKSC